MLDVIQQSKENMAEVMTDYRYKIEELERKEYMETDEIAERCLKQLQLNQELTHNGEYCKFIEVVPSKKIFRIFKGDRVVELDYSEVLNLNFW